MTSFTEIRPRISLRKGRTAVVSNHWIRHPELYILGGDIVLVCEHTVFRIWRGILAVNSEVFQDMFALGVGNQPLNYEKYDGVPLVRLYDTPRDMEVLLRLLFIAKYALNDETPPFDTFSALLRLSTKYMIHAVRDRMVKVAERLYPTNFEDWETFYRTSYPPGSRDTFPHSFSRFSNAPRPSLVLDLFQKCHVMKCLPAAFHDMCGGSIDELFGQDKYATLSPEDLRLAVIGHQKLKTIAYHNRITMLFDGCPSCKPVLAIWLRDEFVCMAGEPAYPSPLQFYSNRFKGKICQNCHEMMNAVEGPIRIKAWEELPGIFGLPSWNKLTNEF